MLTKRLLPAVLILSSLLGACGSGGSDVSSSGEYLVGLDKAVVDEVLRNPATMEVANSMAPENRAYQYQGNARYFIVCRNAFDTYQRWLLTGSDPVLASLPEPKKVAPGGFGANVRQDYEGLKAAFENGDPSRVRALLLDPATCGMVPATPGDHSGPSIADAVEGLA